MDQKQNQLIKNNSMVTSSPSLTAQQLDLIKYAVLTNTTVATLRSSLVDLYEQPVFGPISTKYLNRVAIRNVRKALASFQLNPKGKSKYQHLPQGYCVYHQFRHLPLPKFIYKELTLKQYESQFYPPVNQENHLPENQDDHPLKTNTTNQKKTWYSSVTIYPMLSTTKDKGQALSNLPLTQ